MPERIDLTERKWIFLIASIILDIISGASFGMPLIGEALDLIWAPVSSYLLTRMYDNRSLSRLQFWKEILPFTDILPVATLTWATEYTQIGKIFAKRFGFQRKQAKR